AGALPDPTASIQRSGPDFGAGARMGRETTLSVRQRFPLWGKRGLARTSARADARASEHDRVAVLRERIAEAEAAYVRYWHADEAIGVLDRRMALVTQVGEIATVRYSLGGAAQQDAIRAQLEHTNLRAGRIERVADRSEAMATLNAVLGRPADAPLAPPDGTPSLPLAGGLAPRAQELAEHPAVLAQHAREQAAR